MNLTELISTGIAIISLFLAGLGFLHSRQVDKVAAKVEEGNGDLNKLRAVIESQASLINDLQEEIRRLSGHKSPYN